MPHKYKVTVFLENEVTLTFQEESAMSHAEYAMYMSDNMADQFSLVLNGNPGMVVPVSRIVYIKVEEISE